MKLALKRTIKALDFNELDNKADQIGRYRQETLSCIQHSLLHDCPNEDIDPVHMHQHARPPRPGIKLANIMPTYPSNLWIEAFKGALQQERGPNPAASRGR